MVVAKMRSAHVPVKILRLHVEHKHVGKDRIHAARDVCGCLRTEIRRCIQGRLSTASQLAFLRVSFCHGYALFAEIGSEGIDFCNLGRVTVAPSELLTLFQHGYTMCTSRENIYYGLVSVRRCHLCWPDTE